MPDHHTGLFLKEGKIQYILTSAATPSGRNLALCFTTNELLWPTQPLLSLRMPGQMLRFPGSEPARVQIKPD